MISRLLEKSNIKRDTPFRYTTYLMERMNVHGRERTGCSSRNFLLPGQSIITLSHLFKRTGSVLIVKGADILDGTPVYDIKPYLPYVEAHPEARGGFAAQVTEDSLSVELPSDTGRLTEDELKTLTQILRQDPRPHYQEDPAKEYAFEFAGHNIRFVCDGDMLRVKGIVLLAE